MLAAAILIAVPARLQSNKLEIGKVFPSELLHLPKGSSGKPMIVDFFSSSCIVCFKSMPHVNELNKQFKDSVQFLLVGREDGKIQGIYKKFEKKFSLSLTTRFDSVIFKIGGIESMPLYVWVGRDGIIQAITGPKDVDQENIRTFLRAGALPDMSRQRSPFDLNRLYLVNGNGGDDSVYLFRSLLTVAGRHSPILTPTFVDTSKPYFQALGVSTIKLYQYAYIGKNWWSPNDEAYGKIYPVPVFADTDQLDSSLYTQRYNYSVKVPAENRRQLFAVMRSDLNNYFGLDAHVEQRLMPCLKLVCRNNKCDQLRSRSPEKLLETTQVGMRATQLKIAELVYLLYTWFQLGPPFIDATGIDFPIDISIDAILTDFDEVRKRLQKCGLDLIEEKRMMILLVLRRGRY